MLFSTNLFVHLSVLVYRRLFFSIMCFVWGCSIEKIFQYYVLQEVCRFLYFIKVSWFLQVLVLVLKIGLSPLFFWSLIIRGSLKGILFSWFISVQKLYGLVLFYYLVERGLVFFLVLSLFFLYVRMWGVFSLKWFLILRRCERLGWFLMWAKGITGLILLFSYLLVIYRIRLTLQNRELIVVFMSVPVRVIFFFKLGGVIVLRRLMGLCLLFTLVISILTLSQTIIFLRSVVVLKNLSWWVFFSFLVGFIFII